MTLAPEVEAPTLSGERGAPMPCERRAIVDAASGVRVYGAEDLAYVPEKGELYLSAYNRQAVTAARDGDASEMPGGAIYAADIEAIRAQDGAPIQVRKLSERRVAGALIHPHGMAVSGDGKVAIVDRGYARVDGEWQRHVRILTFTRRGERLKPTGVIRHPALCRANDLAYAGTSALLVTGDHGTCSVVGRWLEDALALEWGTLVRVEDPTGEPRVRVVAEDLAFPNGIVVAQADKRVFVAETRGERIAVLDLLALRGPGPVKPEMRVELAGGPDNLTLEAGGRVIAAVHPSLWRFALARYGWFGVADAPSRIVAYVPATGRTLPLLNARSAAQIAAATSAVALADTIVVSSVIDDALLTCAR